MQIFQKTIATLRSLYLYYQNAHWLSSGSQYYGDHLLFERLYNATSDDVDMLGEKALGITQDEASVDLLENIDMVYKILSNMQYDADSFFDSAVKLERALVKLCSEQAKSDENTEGVKNMFAGLADKHEGHVYLLQQRLRGLKFV
jgi:DNA-binding ferritin-like protein